MKTQLRPRMSTRLRNAFFLDPDGWHERKELEDSAELSTPYLYSLLGIWEDKGWIEWCGGSCRLTDKGKASLS